MLTAPALYFTVACRHHRHNIVTQCCTTHQILSHFKCWHICLVSCYHFFAHQFLSLPGLFFPHQRCDFLVTFFPWRTLLARVLEVVDGRIWFSLVSASSEVMAPLEIFWFWQMKKAWCGFRLVAHFFVLLQKTLSILKLQSALSLCPGETSLMHLDNHLLCLVSLSMNLCIKYLP